MKKVFFTLLVLIFAVTVTNAQYQPGKNTFGALIGFGGGSLNGTGGIPIAVEYNFANVLDKKIHLGAFASYASTSENYGWGFGNGKWKYSNFIIACQANYHFMPGDKLDPFAGLSLGYNVASASWSWDGPGGGAEPSASAGGLFWNIQGGLNYWFSPKWALQVRLGYFPYFGVGVTAAL